MTCGYTKILNLAKLGEWEAAHLLVQKQSDPLSCLIHGYLHRVEGDLSNAQYWYKRAKTSLPINTLEEEFNRLLMLVEGRSN